MKITSNIELLINKFQSLANKSQAIDFSAALTVGVNAALGQMKYRVFNTGKDAKGIAFGKYAGNKTRATNRKFRVLKYGDTEESAKEKKKLQKGLKKNNGKTLKGLFFEADLLTEYEKERVARGRQVKYKDLELTGSLRRGIIVVVESPTKVVVAIPNEKLFLIAEGQQKQISKILGTQVILFGLSDEERDLMKTNIKEALNQLYARLLNFESGV